MVTRNGDEPSRVGKRAEGDRDDGNDGVDTRQVIHGVDFSGARQAGGKIRIATGVLDDGLRIERCRSVAETIGTPQRGPALEYLREFLAGERRAVVGLDFSFGVPHELMDAEDWRAFVQDFDFESVEAMTDTYVGRTRKRTDGERTYLKRATDEETGASSPYGFVVAAQTYYGIQDVLRPLARDGRVSVLPMDDPGKSEPWLCEIYPAATLRDLGLPDETYKNDGKYPDARSRRERIVSSLREAGLSFAEEEIVETAIADSGGDALDSIVAAVAIARAFRENRLTAASDSYDDRRRLEGHIYV
ncbi:hypothetical protein BRC86_04875 [Halobacteriales archaeon QS_3_64_16]|nr:MAG: hypothetical protein BRC86_04875 [Halobacteriales archaeon QS_3_64_16]